MFKSIVNLTAVVLLFLTHSAEAVLIEYDVNRTVEGGSVVGTITTDGTIGDLTAANFSAFSLTINYGGVDSVLIDSSAGGVLFLQNPSQVSASAINLFYDFSIDVNDNNFNFSYNTSTTTSRWLFNDFANGGQEALRGSDISGSIGLAEDRAGFVAFANVTAVPEPSTLAIFALGLMGLASRRFMKQS